MSGESPQGLAFGFAVCRGQLWVVAMAVSTAGAKFLQKMWEGPFWEGVWPCLDPMDGVCLRPASWERPEEVRAARRALFLPHEEEAFLPYKGSGVQARVSCTRVSFTID